MSDFKIIKYRGKWAYSFTDTNGKRRRYSLGTTDLTDAERKLKQIKRVHELSLLSDAKLIGDLWERYRSDKSNLASIETAEYQWMQIDKMFGDLSVDQVTRQLCRQYVEKRQSQNKASATIHGELSRLRMILKHAENERLIDRAPFVELPKNSPPRTKYLTKDQFKQYLEHVCAKHVNLFCKLAVGTGARKSALLRLRWEFVDFNRSLIDLRGDLSTSLNKGRAIVPMNREVYQALLEAKNWAMSPYVVEWAGKPVSDVKKALKNAAKRSGMTFVSAHVFRHSAAVWMAEGGSSMTEIAQYLGHSNTSTTERVYARYSPDYQRKAAENLVVGYQ